MMSLFLATPLLGVSLKRPKSLHLPISCNGYNWITFYSREGKEWGANLNQDIGEFAKSGITAYEPSIISSQHAKDILVAIQAHHIAMPSIYVNSVLHEKEAVEKSINSILEIADIVRSFGTKIVVTNPSPIQWGGQDLKNDAQLIIQANAMERLGTELRKRDMLLAYHTHDMELKAGAREFHHVLQNTTAKNVSFCFDVHWIYRGSQNSEVAVFDVLKMYGHRIAELHIRQSINGIWSEVFTAHGDIDYLRFAQGLQAINIQPHLVIEQCVEKLSEKRWDAITAHQMDLKEVKRIFSRQR